jgi:DNA-binding IclR family transcriptional regulator
MARPALSANRMMDVLDLFAAFPGRSFNMSEIMRAADINVASCHALLNALSSRGYLIRREKNYTLGSALITVGQAASQSQPLVTRAQTAASALNQELGTAVVLSVLAGDDILALTSLPGAAGHFPGFRTGQRMPLEPPAGVHFLAWASEDAISAWIARAKTENVIEIAAWRQALALTRSRGFHVSLLSRSTSEFATLMRSMAVGSQPLEYKAQVSRLMNEHGWTLEQPETIEPDKSYDIGLIAAPVFDGSGQALLSLGLGGFSEQISGEKICFLANRLMDTCLRIMRDERMTG